MSVLATVDTRVEVLHRPALAGRLASLLTNDEIVVAGIGNNSFDLFAGGHRPQNFYMLGSMGLAVPIGFGIALTLTDRQVVILEGDGSLLMSLGALATVGMVAPPNLTIVAWDNGVYQTTGGQETATATSTDLVQVARGAGIARSDWARDERDFDRLVRDALRFSGPAFIGVRVAAEPSTDHPEFDPVILKDRFMRAIGAKP